MINIKLIRFLILNLLIITSIYISFANDVVDFPSTILTISKPLQIEAKAYILIDYNSDVVLTEKNADVRRDPASLTKLMTSYIIGQAIKIGKIAADDTVIISNNAWATGNPLFRGSSLMFLKPGDKVSVSQLNRGIILISGNDACVAIAEYISGSQQKFVDLMNNYAQKMNLKNTHFKTVHGLDALGQFSSARDIAMLSKALISDIPNEYVIYKEKNFTYNKINQINRNGLLWDTNMNIDGIKTGYTKSAGYNLVASSVDNEQMRLISVVLGSQSIKSREIESRKLLAWGFRFFETIIPLKANEEFITKQVWFSNGEKVKIGVNRDIYLTIPRGRTNDLKMNCIFYHKKLYAPLIKNKQIGTICFQIDNKTIKEEPLIILNEIKKGNFVIIMLDYIKLLFYSIKQKFFN